MKTRLSMYRTGILSILLAIFVSSPHLLLAKGPMELTHGFKLIEKRFVKEVNADCYYYIHEASGAKLIKIATNDPNKTFDITFKTLPESDNGVAHIMEHSVLNGSKNFPVKSPFDIAVKGSLNTFINAMTSKDRTTYPVASMNEKDYFNLMHIYLDAVFFPLIYQDKRILMQEGWHHELTQADAPVEYRGVVYGEMKGAFSNPARYVNLYTYRNLFPNSIYGNESGGYPPAIPELTYEEFTQFHEKFYHPDNSYIMLYGDADIDKELRFIDENYLSKFKKRGIKIEIKDHAALSAMKQVDGFYPAMEGAPLDNQTYLSLSYVDNYGTDLAKNEAISLLAYYLFNMEAAPVRLAMQEAGIGKNLSCNLSSYKQNVVQIQVQNANLTDKDKFYQIIRNTLQKMVEGGIPKAELESVLNAYEFSLREDNNAQKGITYMSSLMPSFLYFDNPFIGLEYEKNITALRSYLKSDYYEKLIQSVFLNNPYSLLLSVSPKVGMDNEIQAEINQELSNYKAKLSAKEIDALIKETEELIAYQQSEDKPEALATIPVLSLSDINPKAQTYTADVKKMGDIKVLHRVEHTNHIVYLNLYFDMRRMPKEMLPYASLLTNLLGALNTENYSFGELDMEINKHIGGINTYLTRYSIKNEDGKLQPKFVVTSKASVTKINEMLRLIDEIINKSKLDDNERIKTILTRHLSQLEAQIKREGSGLAMTRYSSYLSNAGMFNELTRGYDYLMFIRNLVKNFDTNSGEILSKLKEVASQLFAQENLVAALTCNEKDYAEVAGKFKSLTNALPHTNLAIKDWNFDVSPKNEGIQAASKVQYVYAGYNFRKLGYDYSGKMLILNNVISRNWLYQQVRVIGGAYGGYSIFSPSGFAALASYRDPNLSQTLATYQKTAEFVKNFTADEKEMTQFIIGAISNLDQPLSVEERGTTAFSDYFSQLDAAYYQKERDEVLATTVADIQSYADMIEDILEQQVICVYGNSDILAKEASLFKMLLRVE